MLLESKLTEKAYKRVALDLADWYFFYLSAYSVFMM